MLVTFVSDILQKLYIFFFLLKCISPVHGKIFCQNFINHIALRMAKTLWSAIGLKDCCNICREQSLDQPVY